MKNASSYAALAFASAVSGMTVGYSVHASNAAPGTARFAVAITNHPAVPPTLKAEK